MKHLQKYDTIFEASSKTEEEIKQDIEAYFMDIIDSAGAECKTTIEFKGYLDIDFKDRAYAGHPQRDGEPNWPGDRSYDFSYTNLTKAKHKTYLFRIRSENKAMPSDKILKCYNKLEKDEEYFTFEFRAHSNYDIDELFDINAETLIDFYVVERPKKK